MAVDYKPEGYNTVSPYLIVPGAERLIEFMRAVLGAQERSRLPGPDGSIGHAEVLVGESVVMLADPSDVAEAMPAMLSVYVEDCDETYRRALDAGATSLREPNTEFYGDRMAGVQDPMGNKWYFATHVEDVSPEEMQRRAAEMAAQAGQG
jgi:PhnB protein